MSLSDFKGHIPVVTMRIDHMAWSLQQNEVLLYDEIKEAVERGIAKAKAEFDIEAEAYNFAKRELRKAVEEEARRRGQWAAGKVADRVYKRLKSELDLEVKP